MNQFIFEADFWAFCQVLCFYVILVAIEILKVHTDAKIGSNKVARFTTSFIPFVGASVLLVFADMSLGWSIAALVIIVIYSAIIYAAPMIDWDVRRCEKCRHYVSSDRAKDITREDLWCMTKENGTPLKGRCDDFAFDRVVEYFCPICHRSLGHFTYAVKESYKEGKESPKDDVVFINTLRTHSIFFCLKYFLTKNYNIPPEKITKDASLTLDLYIRRSDVENLIKAFLSCILVDNTTIPDEWFSRLKNRDWDVTLKDIYDVIVQYHDLAVFRTRKHNSSYASYKFTTKYTKA